MHNILTIKSVS